MAAVVPIERCAACRARLGLAEVCSRCGTDYTTVRRAERQAQALVQQAVQQWAQGQTAQAASTAKAACDLADAPLARVVALLAAAAPPAAL